MKIETIKHNGRIVGKDWPAKLKQCQSYTHIRLDGKTYERIPYKYYFIEGCGDCATSPGDFHYPGCDMEVCPACHGQLLSCACEGGDLLSEVLKV